MQTVVLATVQTVSLVLTELHELHVGLIPRFILLDLGSPICYVSCSP